MVEFEYSEDDESTWKFQRLPDIPEWFQDELRRLGGVNPHGKPILRVVKGNEEMSDKTAFPCLKYLTGYAPPKVRYIEYRHDGETLRTANIEDVPKDAFITNVAAEGEPLGKLRYIVERWASPYELDAQKRFRNTTDEYGRAVLRDFPREGIYEQYFEVQTENEGFRPLTREVFDEVAARWRFDQLPAEQREQIAIERDAQRRVAERDRKAERVNAAARGDLKLDKDELEKRNEFWANYDHGLDAQMI